MRKILDTTLLKPLYLDCVNALPFPGTQHARPQMSSSSHPHGETADRPANSCTSSELHTGQCGPSLVNEHHSLAGPAHPISALVLYKGRPLQPGEAVIAVGTSGALALVDLADLPRVARWRWRVGCTGKGGPYAYTGSLSMGHLVLGVASSNTTVLDHRNGDTLDYRRQNLRMVTRAANAMNVHRAKRISASGYRGVCANGAGWKVRLARCNLGTYRNIGIAALVYDSAVREKYGPHALYNFPRPGERGARTGLTALNPNTSHIPGQISPERQTLCTNKS